MPDPTRETVSASQAAALFGQSPYLTKMALYHWLKDGTEIDEENDRMTIGTLLEDDILTLVQRKYGLDVAAVQQGPESYVRHPAHPVGCTLDAWTACPTRGKAIVEAKNVDTSIFYKNWTFDEAREPIAAPPHIEIQVQTEMLAAEASWGIIAALVGGNRLVCLERKPKYDVQQRIVAEARALLEQVRTGDEPPAQGAIDYEIIKELLPPAFDGELLDLRGDLDEEELGVLGPRYAAAAAERLVIKHEEDALRGQLLDRIRRLGGPGVVLLDNGTLRPSRGRDTYYRHPPEVGMLLDILGKHADEQPEAVRVAMGLVRKLENTVARKGSVKVTWRGRE